MLTAVEGVYRGGKIELLETPNDVSEDMLVIVTFIQPKAASASEVALSDYGIDREQAAELRARLMPFAEDWEQPEMDVYDNYDAAKSSR